MFTNMFFTNIGDLFNNISAKWHSQILFDNKKTAINKPLLITVHNHS